jgi:hypothetical protein
MPHTNTDTISQIAAAILAYLAEHPKAQDTLEGIVEWWLLEQEIKRRTAMVQEALTELLAKGLVVERKGRDGRMHYRLNGHKRREIAAVLKQWSQ